jgi:hypothetical protein
MEQIDFFICRSPKLPTGYALKYNHQPLFSIKHYTLFKPENQGI